MLAKAIAVFVLTLHIVLCNLALAEELNVDLNLSCDLSNWTSSGQFTSFDSKPYRSLTGSLTVEAGELTNFDLAMIYHLGLGNWEVRTLGVSDDKIQINLRGRSNSFSKGTVLAFNLNRFSGILNIQHIYLMDRQGQGYGGKYICEVFGKQKF